jgi:multiple sugar transport system ATP-binding protein
MTYTHQSNGPSVGVNNLAISFGNLQVINNLSIEVKQGEFVVLLGPSGCGKSTLLNAIAGLQPIKEGSISIAGRDVTEMEPKDRGIAMVFQSYALYPTMDVARNLSFGLRVARTPKDEIERRVARAAEMLELMPLLKRKPSQLSGGQRQRVAIGRALVREVDVFLFDEPLSNLDAQLRAELRVEIKRLHQRLGNTMIYVTHDQVEAMTLADRIAVMKGGIIQQLDHPDVVYSRPANLFVAGFVGAPPMNLIRGEITAERTLKIEGGTVPINRLSLGGLEPGQTVTVGVRPENIAIGDAAQGSEFVWDAQLDLRESLGAEALFWCKLGTKTICARTPPSIRLTPGQMVKAGFNFADISFFDTASGNRINEVATAL